MSLRNGFVCRPLPADTTSRVSVRSCFVRGQLRKEPPQAAVLWLARLRRGAGAGLVTSGFLVTTTAPFVKGAVARSAFRYTYPPARRGRCGVRRRRGGGGLRGRRR